MHPERQESTWLYDALAWLEVHRKRLITAGVAALALVVAAYIYVWLRGEAELQANNALLALDPASRTPEKSGAGHDAFVQMAAQHGSSQTAVRALLLAAGELYQAGKYAEAQARFEEVAARDDTALLAPMAALGAAACLDAQDKVDAALAAYQQVVAKYPEEPVAGRAQLATAMLHEARGQFAEALKIYDSLMADRNSGRAGMEASVKREALLKQHPELAATIAPAPPPVAIPMGDGAPPATATNPAAASNAPVPAPVVPPPQ